MVLKANQGQSKFFLHPMIKIQDFVALQSSEAFENVCHIGRNRIGRLSLLQEKEVLRSVTRKEA